MQDQRKADRNQSSGTESSSSDPCCEHKDAVCWSLHRSHQQTRPRSHPTRPTFLEGEARPRECRDRSTVRLGTMQISSSVPSCKRDGWRVLATRQLKRCRLRQSRSPTFRRTHRASKDGRLLSRPFSTDPLTGAAAAVPRWLAAARTRSGSETDSEVARKRLCGAVAGWNDVGQRTSLHPATELTDGTTSGPTCRATGNNRESAKPNASKRSAN